MDPKLSKQEKFDRVEEILDEVFFRKPNQFINSYKNFFFIFQ